MTKFMLLAIAFVSGTVPGYSITNLVTPFGLWTQVLTNHFDQFGGFRVRFLCHARRLEKRGTLSAMHWLQTLDTALFHFINRSLSNPLFDWLMPLLSGGNGVMRWFVLADRRDFYRHPVHRRHPRAAVRADDFSRRRARRPAHRQHHQTRRRPSASVHHALPDVVERLGCTGSGSMPSAHAANWFAATMVVFLFYRQKWLMLPLALAVSFSRVYNGVHYPSDVLAGMRFWARATRRRLSSRLQTLWQWAGEKMVPAWHERLPSLLESRIQNPESRIRLKLRSESDSDTHWLRLGYILIFVHAHRALDLSRQRHDRLEQDEAYQWIWSKHLALSYYSKPLGIALIQFIGTHIFGDTEFGVRFFSPLFAAILSLHRPAISCAGNRRATGVLPSARRHRHAAARHRHDFDDD
jgi:membrane-associated phospholipid phosphatase